MSDAAPWRLIPDHSVHRAGFSLFSGFHCSSRSVVRYIWSVHLSLVESQEQTCCLHLNSQSSPQICFLSRNIMRFFFFLWTHEYTLPALAHHLVFAYLSCAWIKSVISRFPSEGTTRQPLHLRALTHTSFLSFSISSLSSENQIHADIFISKSPACRSVKGDSLESKC